MELEAAKAGYTEDGTVDLQGRPALASKTGKWKACAFLVGTKLINLPPLLILLINLVPISIYI